MLDRLMNLCLPTTAMIWPHLTTGDDFAFLEPGSRLVKRVPPGDPWRLPWFMRDEATAVESFIAGYLSEWPAEERERQLALLVEASRPMARPKVEI